MAAVDYWRRPSTRLLVLDHPPSPTADVAATALQLAAQLRAEPTPSLTGAELALQQEWLARLADSDRE